MIDWFLSLSVGLRIEIVIACAFVIFLVGYLWRERKGVELQKVIFPLLYIFMLKKKWGIRAMQYMANKHRELIKLFGYIGIGVGFVAMGFMVYLFAQIGIWLFTDPAKAALAPAVPFVSIPGIGFLGFTHWLLAIAFLVIVHEFAHGIVSKAHGIKIKSSGIAVLGLVLPIFPAAFVEPDEKKLRKASDVVQYSVFAAGSFMNILWFLVFWLAMLLVLNPLFVGMTEPTGFSFDLVDDSETPAALSGMGNLTLVNMYEGERIGSWETVGVDVFYRLDPGDTIELGYANETSGAVSSYAVTLAEHPDEPGRAYLGIINIMDQRDFKEPYRPIGPYFLWLQGLFKWLVLFNFMVGIFNMLPLVITDGGQMFRLALSRILGNEKKANMITGYVGLVIGAILLAGLGVWFSGLF